MKKRKPEWLKKKINMASILEMEKLLRNLSLNTVCEGASCPNRGECFKKHTATFMILGNHCTRNCRFCDVTNGVPCEVDIEEPKNLAKAAKELGLKHVVVTSVTRDDLPDGGATHFANVIKELKKELPNSSIEVLIPDLKGDRKALEIVMNAKPNILNHNVETVKELYSKVRPMAIYERSMELLRRVKIIDPSIYSKTGIMVGLGETKEQVIALMEELVKNNVEMLTIGQYLQPSKEHLEVVEYIHPDIFEEYKVIGERLGIKYIASGPFVRSSYNAAEGMKKMMEK